MKPRKRESHLVPLPEGIQVGDTVRYYTRGWHIGKLEKVKGNEVGIHIPNTYANPNPKREPRLKWVAITDIKRVDE